jgi:hypothetical protein
VDNAGGADGVLDQLEAVGDGVELKEVSELFSSSKYWWIWFHWKVLKID